MKRLLLILLAGSLLFGQIGCASRSYNYSSYREEKSTPNNHKRSADTSNWFNVLWLGTGESVTITLNDGSKIKGVTEGTTDEFISILTAKLEKNHIARQNVLRVENIVGNSAGDGLRGNTSSLASLNQPTEGLVSRKPVDDLQGPFTFDLTKVLGFGAAGALVGALIDAAPKKRLVYEVK
jgi:hypothetical protein